MVGRWLFATTLGIAGLLLAAIALCPLLAGERGPRVVQLFAQDVVVRRTALASALGLTVTAFLFFTSPSPGRERSKPRKPRTPGAVGA